MFNFIRTIIVTIALFFSGGNNTISVTNQPTPPPDSQTASISSEGVMTVHIVKTVPRLSGTPKINVQVGSEQGTTGGIVPITTPILSEEPSTAPEASTSQPEATPDQTITINLALPTPISIVKNIPMDTPKPVPEFVNQLKVSLREDGTVTNIDNGIYAFLFSAQWGVNDWSRAELYIKNDSGQIIEQDLGKPVKPTPKGYGLGSTLKTATSDKIDDLNKFLYQNRTGTWIRDLVLNPASPLEKYYPQGVYDAYVVLNPQLDSNGKIIVDSNGAPEGDAISHIQFNTADLIK